MKRTSTFFFAVILVIAAYFCFGVTSNAAKDKAVAPGKQKEELLLSAANQIVLYEQEVGNLTNEQVDKIWPSNDTRSYILSGVMDGELTKRYKAWENKYKRRVAGTEDQRGLEDDTDLTIYVMDLNINSSGYKDIRLNLDYISNGGASCLTNAYCLEVYAVDKNHKKYGPFHLDSFEPKGFYQRTQGDTKRYDREFTLVTESIKVPANTQIVSLEIKPYANYPARIRATQQQATGKSWRGKESLTFALAGMKVTGYKNTKYQKPDYIKNKKIDVNATREKTVKRMYDLATVKWTTQVGFGSMYASLVKSNTKIIHQPGSVNYGLPYTQRNRATLEKFVSEIKDGVLYVPSNIAEVWGVDCVASVDYSLAKYISMPVMNLTPDFIWDRNQFTLLGNLKIDGKEYSSEALKQNYSEQEIYKAYAQLQKGDVLSTHWQKGAHTRLVSGNTHVVRNSGGAIDPQESYIIMTEISSGLADTADANNYGGLLNHDDYAVPFEPKKEYTDIKAFHELAGKNTNFRVNKKVAFKQAYDGCYVPLTLNAYLTATVEEPYARIINANTAGNIKNGLKGTIYSNYTIISLKFHIKNKDSGEERTFVVYPNHASGTLEGKYNGMYSLYYNTPQEIQSYVKDTLKGANNFDVSIYISAGEKENMEVLKLSA